MVTERLSLLAYGFRLPLGEVVVRFHRVFLPMYCGRSGFGSAARRDDADDVLAALRVHDDEQPRGRTEPEQEFDSPKLLSILKRVYSPDD
jgi:hypothetical protein